MTKVCGQVSIPSTDNTPLECPNFYNSNCVIYKYPISYFGTTEPSTATEVFNFIIASLQDARGRIVELEENPVDVLGTVLTGFNPLLTGDVVDSDTLIVALGKLQYQLDNNSLDVLGTILTGFDPLLTGDVEATDSILTAMGKIQYQLNNTSGGGDFVTLDTVQNILAYKIFDVGLNSKGPVAIGGSDTSSSIIIFDSDDSNTLINGNANVRAFSYNDMFGIRNSSQVGGVGAGALLIDQNNTAPRTALFPDKSGTVAFIDDIVETNNGVTQLIHRQIGSSLAMSPTPVVGSSYTIAAGTLIKASGRKSTLNIKYRGLVISHTAPLTIEVILSQLLGEGPLFTHVTSGTPTGNINIELEAYLDGLGSVIYYTTVIVGDESPKVYRTIANTDFTVDEQFRLEYTSAGTGTVGTDITELYLTTLVE